MLSVTGFLPRTLPSTSSNTGPSGREHHSSLALPPDSGRTLEGELKLSPTREAFSFADSTHGSEDSLISNNEELFGVISALIDTLKHDGNPAKAEALQDALTISTVPGEVLGEIRLQLQNLKGAGAGLDAESRPSVDDALAYLNRVLR